MVQNTYCVTIHLLPSTPFIDLFERADVTDPAPVRNDTVGEHHLGTLETSSSLVAVTELDYSHLDSNRSTADVALIRWAWDGFKSKQMR